MSKQVKKMLVDDMRSALSGVQDVLVMSINGLDGTQNNQMRLALRKKNIRLQVVKNSLARQLFDELGLGAANSFLEGPSAVAWGSQSIVDLAKEITDWSAKLKKLQIKGGATAGKALSADHVKTLSKLPSREELIGRIVSLALGPAARVASLVNAPAARIAGQLKTKAEAAAEPAAGESAAGESAAGADATA